MVTREFFALNILRTNMIVAIHKNFVTHHHQIYINDMMIVMCVFNTNVQIRTSVNKNNAPSGLPIQFDFHLNIAYIAQYHLYTVEHNYAIALRLKQLMFVFLEGNIV